MVLVVFIAVAFAVAQILIGGTRLLYSIPASLFLAAAAIVTAWPKLRASPATRVVCVFTTILLCAYLLVRDHFSPVDYLARQDFILITGSLAVYLLTALFLERSKLRLWILFTLLVLAMAHVIIGAVQFRQGNQFMLLPWIHRTDDSWRASGFYISPNHFAGLIEVIALFSLSLVVWSDLKSVYKILIGYCGLCCMIGLAISGSRGGYLSISFGLLIFAALSLAAYRAGRFGPFLPVLLGVCGALAVLAVVGWLLVAQSGVLKARVAAVNEPENMRWLLWHAALQQFHLSPLWGTGSGTFLYYGRMFRPATVQNDPINVHNDYLHLLAEYGVAGAVAFALFYFSHVIAGVRNILLLVKEETSLWSTRANQLALQIGAMSAVAAYTMHSVVDFNLHIPANAFLMAWVFGMIANPVATVGGAKKAPALSRGVTLAARVALVLAGVALVAFGVPKLPGEWYAEQTRVALRDYRLEDARALAAKALTYEKRNPDIYYYAGEAAREMSARKMGPELPLAQEAIAMFQEALTQFPQDVRCRLKLAQTYDALRQFGLAEEQLIKAVELDPTNSYVNAYYGLHYQSEGLLEDAAAEYELAVQRDDRNPLARAGLDEVRKALAPEEQKTSVKPSDQEMLDEALREAGVPISDEPLEKPASPAPK